MAGPTPTPPPAKGGPSLLKNLNPKQKKVLAVVGVGAFLALIFLLSKRSAPEAPQAGEAAPNPEADPFGAPVAAGGTDPTAFLGAQSEAIGGRLEEVSGGLAEVGVGLGEVGQGLGEVERGQEELGETFMAGQEADQEEFGRVQAGLAGQSRQLAAIRKKLQAGKKKGGGKKGANARPRPKGKAKQKPRGKGRKGKKPPRKQRQQRRPPRKRRR